MWLPLVSLTTGTYAVVVFPSTDSQKLIATNKKIRKREKKLITRQMFVRKQQIVM